MRFADKLDQVLTWTRSHSERLKRKGFEPPNHLANGSIRVFVKDLGPICDIELADTGAAPAFTPDFPVTRLEVRDAADELLFAEDYPEGLTP